MDRAKAPTKRASNERVEDSVKRIETLITSGQRDYRPHRHEEVAPLMAELGLREKDAGRLLNHTWLHPIVEALQANKVQIIEIAPTASRTEPSFMITFKPTHCAPKMRQSRVRLVVGESGRIEQTVLKGFPSQSAVAYHCLEAFEAIRSHLTMLQQIDRLAKLAPNPSLMARQLLKKPWAVYAEHCLSPLPVRLAKLVLRDGVKHPYAQLCFEVTNQRSKGLFAEVSVGPSGHCQTRPLYPIVNGRVLKENHDTVLDAILFTATNCAKSIRHVKELLSDTHDAASAERTAFLNPGLLPCLTIAAKHGAHIKDLSIHHGLQATTAELFLEHRCWSTTNGGLPRLLIGETSLLESNITANGHYSLGSMLQDLNAQLSKGQRFDPTRERSCARVVQHSAP